MKRSAIKIDPSVNNLINQGLTITGVIGGQCFRRRNGRSHLYKIVNKVDTKKGGHKMASVKYATFLTGIKGKQGGIVYYRTTSSTVGRIREYVVPRYTDQNAIMGKALANISNIWADSSAEYKADMTTYARKFANLPPYPDEMRLRANNPTATFNLMMWNFQKANEATIDLATLSLGDIQSLFPELTSVAQAIEAGYLPNVPDGNMLTATMA